MDFEQATEAFEDLIKNLDSNNTMGNFFRWIEKRCSIGGCRGDRPTKAHNPEAKLREIAADLKAILPIKAIMPSEKLNRITKGEDSDCCLRHTVHVDRFLFDDYDVDELVKIGELQRNYCRNCHSHNTAPINFITHSVSRSWLSFIFTSLLPWIEGKTVLDVGSRLGAMLYGAHIYTPAPKIIGVEFNPELCEIQEIMIEKHGFSDRIEVICDDIRNVPDIVDSADVVILNNVFEFFMTKEEQIECWKFLKENIKKGTILITIPRLENSLKNLDTGISVSSWVKERRFDDPLTAFCAQNQDENTEAVSYDVISTGARDFIVQL